MCSEFRHGGYLDLLRDPNFSQVPCPALESPLPRMIDNKGPFSFRETPPLKVEPWGLDLIIPHEAQRMEWCRCG